MGGTTPGIRCFVAMAVGRADTDRIYEDATKKSQELKLAIKAEQGLN